MGTGVSASVGFVGTINAAELGILGIPTNRGYVEGCAVSAGAGTRQVVVASGRVWVGNSYHNVSGATLTLPENTSGQPRRDIVALYVDWSGADAALVSVTGTPSASLPAPLGSLSATAGSAWHVRLADVRVNSGQGTIPAGQVYDVRPGPWIEFTPLSPWSNYGSSFQTCAWRVRPDGDVELRGMPLTTSTITTPSAQPFVVMPQGYRPSKVEPFTVTCRDGSFTSAEHARVDVSSDGEVRVAYPQSTTGTRWYSLSGIHWTPNA